MKKPKIFFNPIAGSSILSITWFPGPFGDAVEAKNGIGVGFFAHNGDLLCAQFDDVDEKEDHQILKFDHYRVEAFVKKGKVTFSLISLESPKKASRSSKKKNKRAA